MFTKTLSDTEFVSVENISRIIFKNVVNSLYLQSCHGYRISHYSSQNT
jgi:hypothetical protein